MCADVKWKGDCICVTAATTKREFLSCTRLGASSSRVCLEDLEALPVWRNFLDFHGSQEPQVLDESERTEYETEALDGVIKGLCIRRRQA